MWAIRSVFGHIRTEMRNIASEIIGFGDKSSENLAF